MAIDENILILTAREMVTELPESVDFSRESLRMMIKPAISIWQNQTNDDPQRRQNFIVESDAITIAAGQADLSTQIDTKGFRVDFIKESDIVIAYSGSGIINYKVKFVNDFDRLISPGRQDKFFILAYLSGKQITFKDAGQINVDTIGGSFKIRSVVIPSDLAGLPASVMPEIALVIADLCKKRIKDQNRGLNMKPA